MLLRGREQGLYLLILNAYEAGSSRGENVG